MTGYFCGEYANRTLAHPRVLALGCSKTIDGELTIFQDETWQANAAERDIDECASTQQEETLHDVRDHVVGFWTPALLSDQEKQVINTPTSSDEDKHLKTDIPTLDKSIE